MRNFQHLMSAVKNFKQRFHSPSLKKRCPVRTCADGAEGFIPGYSTSRKIPRSAVSQRDHLPFPPCGRSLGRAALRSRGRVSSLTLLARSPFALDICAHSSHCTRKAGVRLSMKCAIRPAAAKILKQITFQAGFPCAERPYLLRSAGSLEVNGGISNNRGP